MGRKTKRLNLILTLLAFLLLLALLFFNRKSLHDTWNALRDVDWRLLIILPALQLASQFFIAHCYSAVFRIYGYAVSIRRTLPMVWALDFVNKILPSGGLSGLSYLIYGLRSYVPAGKATLAQLARYGLSFFSYALVLVAALTFLIMGHDVTRKSITLVVWLVVISLILFSAIVLLSTNVDRVRRINKWLGKLADRLTRLASKEAELRGKRITKTLDEFYDDFRKITQAKAKLTTPLIFMIASTFFEHAIVYASFVIVGAHINPGIVMISFAIANGVGVISVVPGDVGVHETAMIAALSAAGVPVGVAFSGTLLYRVFNKMLFLPIGFVSYSRLLKPALPDSSAQKS